MRPKTFSILVAQLCAVTALLIALSSLSFAQSETVIYSFQGGTDGANPNGGLIADSSGHLFGTTAGGGTAGTVFELVPLTGGGWGEVGIHNFTGANGSSPQSSLVMDAHSNLYGTTLGGGNYGNGIVFELQPVSGGGWTEIVLHNFNFDGINFFDGASPRSNLIIGNNRRLYGTTEFGGTGLCSYDGPSSAPKGQIPSGCGTVFELSPQRDGSWSEKILYSFQGGTDGGLPFAGLIFDNKGNLYGTTVNGGVGSNKQCIGYFDNGCGVVFSLTHNTGATWTENVLYAFTGLPDGANPTGSLIFDHAGNLYGTTAGAGAIPEDSSVFQLSPSSGGWTETTLLSFPNDGSNGYSPLGGLIFDAAGNLYGATQYGSGTVSASVQQNTPPPKNLGSGIIFKLTPAPGGTWSEGVLHDFGGNSDGTYPGYGKLLRKDGAFYGTTTIGGSANLGTVFKIVP